MGRVVNVAGAALPYASVELLRSPGADTVASAAADSTGVFLLRAPPGAYELIISFLSYRSKRVPLELRAGEKRSLGILELEASALELPSVVVRGERSQLQLGFEKRSFRVGTDITVVGGSVLDVLNNVPSLMADFRGNVSLRGSNAVRILINGRPSSIYRNGSRALQNLQAAMIEAVEVITNPSAKYSAEGDAGIINIILKKQDRHGVHGSVGVMQRVPESTELSAELNYRRGALNWFVNASVAYAEDPAHTRTYQRYESPDTGYIYLGIDDGRETDYDGDVRFGADLTLDAASRLTLSGLWHFEDKRDLWHGAYVDSTLTGAFLDRISRSETVGGGESGGGSTLEYLNTFGDHDEDHRLDATLEWEHNSEKELPRVTETDDSAPDAPLHTDINDIVTRDALRFKADYVHPLADSGKVEVGALGTYQWRDNRYDARERTDGGAWTPLPTLTSNYSVFDAVNGAYITASSYLGKLAWQLGVRGEQYSVRTGLTTADTATTQAYLDLFPSAFLTYRFTPQRSLQLSYSRRINRPNPRLLLPATRYSTSRSRFSGNPDLRPEYGDSYEAQLLQAWKTGSVLASIYYRHQTDVVQRVSRLDGDGILRTVPINLATSDDRGLEFTGEKEVTDAIRLAGSFNLFRSSTRGSYQGERYRTDTNRLTGRVQLRWQVTDGLKVQSALRYYGPARTVQGRRAGIAFVNFGIARDLLDGRATVALNSEDLFNTRREILTIVGSNFRAREETWEPSGVRLSFTYRINQAKEEDEEGE